jgi:class 3 adenylate cyclase/tetratricopeptide (TPR) repeat protein/ribosomal protein L40E
MRCSKCGSENPAGNNFCARCGNALARLCLKCGAENAPPANFCGKCGATLDTLVSTPVSPTPPIQPSEVAGERRHLTVLFCDLVGSTAIASQLDPEEWRETVAGYHRAAAEAITRFDGQVAKYLGDGVMAYFGWPAAHDNDAERAARAGLAILDAIAKLNEEPGHANLSARVGIDSGTIVIGKGAGNETEVFGDTPNIAARVQSAAEPGTVAISDATHRLVSGLFIVEDCGAQQLKGIERPINIYRVVQPSGARGRFDVATAAGGLTSFVGREDELRSLMHRWERVLAGEGQVALIIGEGGIGKSRLVQRFHEQIAGTPHTWIEVGAGAFFQNTPFYPVIEMLWHLVWQHGLNRLDNYLQQLQTDDQKDGRKDAPRGGENIGEDFAQLQSGLLLAGLKPAEAIPLIAPLLNLAPTAQYPPSMLSPDQQRRRLLATLVEWVIGSARVRPLVIATEDLHWADPSTLELIQILVEQGATARLLLLYTARPEFRAPWPMRAHHTQITLNRLSVRDVRTMVAQVAACKALADDTVATVVERTGGIPLFVEELTRAVLESGDAKLTGREIPATLHDSLMARLDRLGSAKEIIQVGAVIGNDFSYELLHAVHLIGEAELQAALRKLTDAELLYIRGIAPDATYQFKHALIRDAAYEALLKSRRKELHRTVARAIDEKFPALKEAHPEVLARHWTEAGEADPAISEWQRAGARAVERHAYREAEQHYREALGVLQILPDSSQRDATELTLQVALGSVMELTRGFSATETIAVYGHARTVAERIGGTKSLEVFTGLWAGANTRGEPRQALAFADQMLEIAQGLASRPALVSAHYARGLVCHHLGKLDDAGQHLLLAIEQYHEEDFIGASLDPGVRSLSWAGPVAWRLGHADRALRRVGDALSAARRQNHPYNLAFAIFISSTVHLLRGDLNRLREATDETESLSTGFGFPLWNPLCKIRGAWARAKMGETDGAVDEIREGLAELDAMKFFNTRANMLGMLCETQGLAGAIDDALLTIEQALRTNPDETIHRPNLLRLRGELRLKGDSRGKADVELAEHDFSEAIELARGMSAKSDELRATTSLARLLENTGRRDQARTMLSDIYYWFTEGFDTADLIDAKALLDQL